MEPQSQEPVAQVVADRITGEDEVLRRRAQREVMMDAMTLAVSALVVGTNAFESVPMVGDVLRDAMNQLPPIDGLQLSPDHIVNTLKIGLLVFLREGVRDGIWMFTVARRADIFKKKLRLALAETT